MFQSNAMKMDRFLPRISIILEKSFTNSRRVLVPGTGLSRLLMEVVKRGYGGQGNEFSYQMLLTSNYMLNHVVEPYSVWIDYWKIMSRLKFSHGPTTLTIFSLQEIIIAEFVFQILFLLLYVEMTVTFPCARVNLSKATRIKRTNGIVCWLVFLWILPLLFLSNFLFITLNIEHWTLNIEHWTLNIENNSLDISN